MNKLTIIGNLTADPELRTTTSGKDVCSFTVAVNRKKTPGNQNPGADYFKVNAWEERGKICSKYLKKGSKVCVIGSVSVRPYTNNKGEAAASMEVKPDDIEFLSSTERIDRQSGYQQVEPDDLPY